MSAVGETLKLLHPLVDKYLRKERMPHMACSGCGIGQVVHSTLLAVDDLGLTPQGYGLGSGGRMQQPDHLFHLGGR